MGGKGEIPRAGSILCGGNNTTKKQEKKGGHLWVIGSDPGSGGARATCRHPEIPLSAGASLHLADSIVRLSLLGMLASRASSSKIATLGPHFLQSISMAHFSSTQEQSVLMTMILLLLMPFLLLEARLNENGARRLALLSSPVVSPEATHVCIKPSRARRTTTRQHALAVCLAVVFPLKNGDL